MKIGNIYNIILSIMFINLSLNGTSLRDAVKETINTNPDIIAEHFNKKASRTNIEEQQRDYNPTVDFSMYVEDSTTYNDPDNAVKNSASKDGFNANVKIEQVLYDGGVTPNEVELYKHRYQNVKYTSKDTVEDLILQVINVYTKLVSYQELVALDNYKIKIHEEYLKKAQAKEKISGEILDSYQVSSKIKAIMDNYLTQEVDRQKAYSNYKKLTGEDLKGNICKPVLNEKLIPKTIDKAIEIALRNNTKIKAQKALINEQMAQARISDAKFRPTLKFQLEGLWDNDLQLPENGEQDIYRARLESTWNLYNGGKDDVASQRERIVILQQKKILDSITNSVIDKIKGSYNTYFKIKKRIENMKLFVEDNKKIVDIYNQQLTDGSRTFLDMLNAEAELFRTKVLLIQLQFSQYDEYYNILRSMNVLSDAILNDKNQVCGKYVFDDTRIIKEEKQMSEEELSKQLGLE